MATEPTQAASSGDSRPTYITTEQFQQAMTATMNEMMTQLMDKISSLPSNNTVTSNNTTNTNTAVPSFSFSSPTDDRYVTRRSQRPQMERSYMGTPSSTIEDRKAREEARSISHANELDQPDSPRVHHSSDKELQTLQRAMAKPSNFDGDDEKGERITTWWRQMINYVGMYPDDMQAFIAKSYLKGSAASWLESREVELKRELTLQELKEGLAIEYGSDVAAAAALDRIKMLSMAEEKYNTIQSYNAEFNKLYSLLSPQNQIIAVDCYISGLLPKYQKEISKPDNKPWTLTSAREAAVKAVTKVESIDLAYKRFNAINKKKVYGSSSTGAIKKASAWGRNNNNRNNSTMMNGTTSNAATVTRIQSVDTESHETEGEEGEVRKEGQVSAIQSKPSSKQGFKLNDAQVALLRKEGRCFHCHQKGHMKPGCKNAAATSAPVPLNQ
jgi:hypothetical protein